MEIATAGSSAPKPGNLPGLDVVRGVAILIVLLDHGLAIDQTVYERSGSRLMLAMGHLLRLGHLGVNLFFILSGLLITGILLDHRGDRDFFRNFYARRALRILPGYLLILAILFATRSVTARYVGVCLLFMANMTGLFGTGSQYGALWSLSVEEQFYLVWPITVRRLSSRALTLLCVGIILLTPLLRFGLLYGPHVLQDIRFKTWAVGDFFAAGALLAIAWRSQAQRSKLAPMVAPLMISGMLLIAAQHAFAKSASRFLANIFHAIYLEPWLLLLTGFTLFALLHPGLAKPFIARPLLFLAKISYGLYLCHVFVFGLVARHWPASALSPSSRMLLRFLVGAGLSIAVAALSRFTLEEFFLRLKPKHEPSTVSFEAATKIT